MVVPGLPVGLYCPLSVMILVTCSAACLLANSCTTVSNVYRKHGTLLLCSHAWRRVFGEPLYRGGCGPARACNSLAGTHEPQRAVVRAALAMRAQLLCVCV